MLLRGARQRKPRRGVRQHENPVIPTPAGRRRERLDAPTVLLLYQVGNAVARVVPVLALSFGLDDALVQRETLAARRIDDGECPVAGACGPNFRPARNGAVQDDALIRRELGEWERFEETAH